MTKEGLGNTTSGSSCWLKYVYNNAMVMLQGEPETREERCTGGVYRVKLSS